jgi:hypothetical protein
MAILMGNQKTRFIFENLGASRRDPARFDKYHAAVNYPVRDDDQKKLLAAISKLLKDR